MPDIFSSDPGVVAVFNEPGTPMSFFMEGFGGFPFFKSIITGFSVKTRGGVQFMHTLRDFVYIYVFGERIGTINVTGLSFQQRCPGGDSSHGLENVLSYYALNRVEARATPVIIIFGLFTVFAAFLTEAKGNFKDPSQKVATFDLIFQMVPQ